MSRTNPWYNHLCTQCGQRFDCKPCLEPKIHGKCSRMSYQLCLYGTHQVRHLTMYFCKNECAFECFTGLAVIDRLLDSMILMVNRIELIREAMQSNDVEKAEELAEELLQDLEEEKNALKEELRGMGEDIELDETDSSDDSTETTHTDDAEYVSSSSESDENYNSEQDSAGEARGWFDLMKRLEERKKKTES